MFDGHAQLEHEGHHVVPDIGLRHHARARRAVGDVWLGVVRVIRQQGAELAQLE